MLPFFGGWRIPGSQKTRQDGTLESTSHQGGVLENRPF